MVLPVGNVPNGSLDDAPAAPMTCSYLQVAVGASSPHAAAAAGVPPIPAARRQRGGMKYRIQQGRLVDGLGKIGVRGACQRRARDEVHLAPRLHAAAVAQGVPKGDSRRARGHVF